ncbi:MAG TPA: NAD(P) transhydrogenase subunit alpha [Acidimicrobiia bacterium]|nr:NAD(P) transhydrogenase subunit alpha [Acidimicrobiia bacterium]
MEIGIPAEKGPGERRVAVTPIAVGRLVESGNTVVLEEGAGVAAGFPDSGYRTAGAAVVDRQTALSRPLVTVLDLPADLPGGGMTIGLLKPLERPKDMQRLAAQATTSLAFELVPRITRAQGMDALSSQATVAGYQAALEAAGAAIRFFPMLTTAAGTVPPGKALVLGAGVAGLQAIATCRRLGAVVSGFDVRAAAAEQVRSLGATFVEIDVAAQDEAASGGYARELDTTSEQAVLAGLAPFVAAADVVISTASIPGRPAPLLITAHMVASMRPGSVVVDLAASTGGNCELTRPDEVVVVDGVSIVGHTNLPARKPYDASQMYARNVAAFLGLIGANGELDFGDEILDQACVTHSGEIRIPRVRELISS